jgi:uncharacterized protein (TIGR01777 family)
MNKLKIAITGSTGFVGNTVVRYLESAGHSVYRILRPTSSRPPTPTDIRWDLVSQTIEQDKLEGMDVVIHLAGASLADHRWTPAFKKEIFDSRVLSTTFLCGILHQLRKPPKVLLSASAVGYYGMYHEREPLLEDAPPGNDFLANVCKEWEAATKGAELSAIRVIHMRTGAVLGKNGGALSKMLPIFKTGLGGPLGDGNQIFSWICVEEIPRAMLFLIEQAPRLSGPVNFVSPHPVPNKEFTKILGRALNKSTPFPAPPFALRLAMGEMADSLLLSSANVLPKRLTESGYVFEYPTLEKTFQTILK